MHWIKTKNKLKKQIIWHLSPKLIENFTHKRKGNYSITHSNCVLNIKVHLQITQKHQLARSSSTILLFPLNVIIMVELIMHISLKIDSHSLVFIRTRMWMSKDQCWVLSCFECGELKCQSHNVCIFICNFAAHFIHNLFGSTEIKNVFL